MRFRVRSPYIGIPTLVLEAGHNGVDKRYKDALVLTSLMSSRASCAVATFVLTSLMSTQASCAVAPFVLVSLMSTQASCAVAMFVLTSLMCCSYVRVGIPATSSTRAISYENPYYFEHSCDFV